VTSTSDANCLTALLLVAACARADRSVGLCQPLTARGRSNRAHKLGQDTSGCSKDPLREIIEG
jgi:hypothetical protein